MEDSTAPTPSGQFCGVFGRNLMLAGDRLTFSAGVGWGNATVSSYSRDVIGTRAGMQWTW